ncbi:6-phosphofructo-2-kinase/fructose-2 [Paramecium bursaria]
MQELKRSQKKLIIGMVGLPARGKTHISFKINRYLNWIGVKSQMFFLNTLAYEEKNVDFNIEIEPYKEEYQQMKKDLKQKLQIKLSQFLQNGGDVALYNGICYTREERAQTMEFFNTIPDVKVFWIESICDDERVIYENIINSKIKNHLDKQEQFEKFTKSLEAIAQVYETIEKIENTSFIKIINIGRLIKLYKVDGYLQSRIVSFMLNLHITSRPIFLCRSGQTQFNLEDRIGGDSELSIKGHAFSNRLAEYFEEELQNYIKENQQISVITSTLRRSIQTAEVIGQRLNIQPLYTKTLDEIDYGLVDGLTVHELRSKHQREVQERKKNPLDFKYPRGESCRDVINRIEPVIFEIERCQGPIIVITHVTVMKCLYAYFQCNQITEVPNIDFPSGLVIRLDPGAYTSQESRVQLEY